METHRTITVIHGAGLLKSHSSRPFPDLSWSLFALRSNPFSSENENDLLKRIRNRKGVSLSDPLSQPIIEAKVLID